MLAGLHVLNLTGFGVHFIDMQHVYSYICRTCTEEPVCALRQGPARYLPSAYLITDDVESEVTPKHGNSPRVQDQQKLGSIVLALGADCTKITAGCEAHARTPQPSC